MVAKTVWQQCVHSQELEWQVLVPSSPPLLIQSRNIATCKGGLATSVSLIYIVSYSLST